jgi:hypothetical protein
MPPGKGAHTVSSLTSGVGFGTILKLNVGRHPEITSCPADL